MITSNYNCPCSETRGVLFSERSALGRRDFSEQTRCLHGRGRVLMGDVFRLGFQ